MQAKLSVSPARQALEKQAWPNLLPELSTEVSSGVCVCPDPGGGGEEGNVTHLAFNKMFYFGKNFLTYIVKFFLRFSVGGLSDVAELKGHRRT